MYTECPTSVRRCRFVAACCRFPQLLRLAKAGTKQGEIREDEQRYLALCRNLISSISSTRLSLFLTMPPAPTNDEDLRPPEGRPMAKATDRLRSGLCTPIVPVKYIGPPMLELHALNIPTHPLPFPPPLTSTRHSCTLHGPQFNSPTRGGLQSAVRHPLRHRMRPKPVADGHARPRRNFGSPLFIYPRLR